MRIAAFDFDGTITRKDTFIEFVKFTKGYFKLFSGILVFSPLLVLMKLKLYPNFKAKERLFSYYYKGTPIDLFDRWGKEFIPVIEKLTYPKAREMINNHKNNDDTIVIISASIENWIKPWSVTAGIDEVIATKPEIDSDNKLTGKFCTKNCDGKEKASRLLEMFPGRKEYSLTAYGNSRGDKELIECADNGFYNKFK